MTQFISRSQLHSETVAEINQDIELLRSKTHDNQYLSSIISVLNQLDFEYFDPIILEVKQMFDIMKYYIDKDKNKELINPEIPHLIENYLSELTLLAPTSDFNSLNARKKASGKLSPKDLTNFSLQEKMQRLQAIEHDAEVAITNLSVVKDQPGTPLAQSEFEPKVIEGLIKQNEQLTTKEIIRSTRGLMHKEVTKANTAKNRYHINSRWFWILVPILILGMIVTIILPLFI